ncbi:MAG: carboxypeptidase-like regulatory domain-containing protein [Candidatus Diapherotrites archaeon]
MGIIDSFKEKYYEWEDKWYDFLDKIEEKGIPVYKIIEPIDKVMPSFALAMILAIALIVFILTAALTQMIPTGLTLNVIVLDSDNDPISNALIEAVMPSGETQNYETDSEGTAEITGLKEGDLIELTASKEGFTDEFKSVEVSADNLELVIVLEEEGTGYVTKTINLVDAQGMPIYEEATLRFSCSNSYALAPDEQYLSAGDYGQTTVQVPTNCEKLTVNVITNSFAFGTKEINDYDSEGTIYLQEKDPSGGETIDLIVLVKSVTEQLLDGIEVKIFKNDVPMDYGTTYGGKAEFTLSSGTYKIKTYDSQGIFEQAIESIYLDGTEEEVTKEITLNEGMLGKIKIKAVDSEGNALNEAKVKLINSVTKEEIAEKTTDLNVNSGIVEFSLTRDTQYTALIKKQGYLTKEKAGLEIREAIYEIPLDACTPSTCGLLKVKVTDQDNYGIQNATVALFEEKQGVYFLTLNEPQITDLNGEAEFTGVESGTYYAYAFKETLNGESEPSYFNSSSDDDEEIDYTVMLDIPLGKVKVTVKDKFNEKIPNAKVTLMDLITNSTLGTSFANEEGEYILETKADKELYLNVTGISSNEWAEYFTVSKKVIGEAQANFDVILEPPIINKDIEIEFTGLYQNNEEALSVSPGETYTAKFKLRVPEEKNYSEIGVHLRTGEEMIMEKDDLFIKEINAPKAAIVKATSFDSEEMLKQGQYKVTNGDAKWANIVWLNPKAGIYELEAKIKIKETASMNKALKMHYRAWAKGKKTERYPKDETVKNELYSETKTITLDVGSTVLCDEDFCFQASILDKEEDIVEEVLEDYDARLYSKYKLSFTLTNNSESVIHNNANLRIKNSDESLYIESYKVIDAQTEEHSGEVEGFEIPRIEIGDFRQNNKIIAEMDFLANKSGTGIMNLTLVSDQKIVWSKNISVKVSAEKNLVLTIEPNAFMAGISNDLNVTVREEGEKEYAKEVANAVVKLKNKFDETISFKSTPLNGVVHLSIPASEPGTVYWIEASKAGYNLAEKEIKVAGDLIELNPQTLGFGLNIQDKLTETKGFSIKNKTQFPLKVSGMELTGNFSGLLNEQSSGNYFFNQTNTVIDPGEEMEFQALTELSESAKQLTERKDLKGNLKIELINFGKKWSYSIPVTIAIGLGAELDDPACLQITKTEWKAVTQGNPITTEFSVKNNCTVKGKPVAVQMLQAQLNLEGNQIGDYSLTLGDSSIDLRTGYYRTILGTVKEEESLDFMLTFTPFGGVNGASKGSINFKAVNPTDGEPQIVEAKINTELSVINLVDCISFDKELVTINQEEIGNLVISTKGCGGATEIELISKLSLSKDKFSVEDNASQTIEVYAEKNFEGMYGMQVYAKATNQMQSNLQKNIRVLILDPNPNKCISMTKYEFEVFDDPQYEMDGFDSSTIINNCFDKKVVSKVDMKDFQSALKDGSNVFLMSLAVGILSQAAKGKLKNLTDDFTIGDLITKIKSTFKEHEKEISDEAAEEVSKAKTEEEIEKQVNKLEVTKDKPGLILKLKNILGIKLSEEEIKKLNDASKCVKENNGVCETSCDEKNKITGNWLNRNLSCAKEYVCCKKGTTPAKPADEPKLDDLGACHTTDEKCDNMTKEECTNVNGRFEKNKLCSATNPEESDWSNVEIELTTDYLSLLVLKNIDSSKVAAKVSKITLTKPQEIDLSDGKKIILFDEVRILNLAQATQIEVEIHYNGIKVMEKTITVEAESKPPATALTSEEQAIVDACTDRVDNQGFTAFNGLFEDSGDYYWEYMFYGDGPYCVKLTNTAECKFTNTNPPKEACTGKTKIHPTTGTEPEASSHQEIINACDLRTEFTAFSLYSSESEYYIVVPSIGGISSCRKIINTSSIPLTNCRFTGDTPTDIYNNKCTDSLKVYPILGASSPFPSLPSTAFMNVYANNPTNTSVPASDPGLGGLGRIFGGAGGAIGGGISDIFGMIFGGTSKVLGGSSWMSSITGAAMNGLMYSFYSYMQQESDLEFTSIQPWITVDWNKGITLLNVSKTKTATRIGSEETVGAPEGIEFEIEAESSYERNSVDPRLKKEFRQIDFINTGNLTTEPFDPMYALLKVTALEHIYMDAESRHVYNAKDFPKMDKRKFFDLDFGAERIDTSDVELKEDSPEEINSRFHLMFEAVPLESRYQEPKGMLSCQSGTKTGSTGVNALPKVKFEWKWNAIKENECNADNLNAIYCDATQFSISLLKKINDVAKELDSVGTSLQCPSEAGANYNESVIPDNDIGIELITAVANTVSSVEVQAVIKNTNRIPITTNYLFKVIDLDSGEEIECSEGTQETKVLSTENVSCEFTGLEEGYYQAVLILNPLLELDKDKNPIGGNSTASDELRAGFRIGQSGVQDCEPYETSRLSDFYAASFKNSARDKAVLDKVHFTANLMQDGYTSDFQHDFDAYARYEAFFGADETYRNERTGLWKYFSDSTKFKFVNNFGQEVPQGIAVTPGTYDVVINIIYPDNSWKLFDSEGNPLAEIEVKLQKTKAAEPDNPFYYIPIDGLIGQDGRTGYGAGFSGERIKLSDTGTGVYSMEPAGSTPVLGSEVQVMLSEDFKRINSIDRGSLLNLSRAGNDLKMVFSPSNATPIVLKMANNAGEAWAFYSIGVDGGPVDAGTYLSRWNGIGYNCKSFNDKMMVEEFFESPDFKGLTGNRNCAVIDGDNAPFSYGLEFCDTARYGNMYAKTVIYSPLGKKAELRMITANDSAVFKTSGQESETIVLNQAANVQTIGALNNVFELVEQDLVCVSGTDAMINFWWNPKAVFEAGGMEAIEAEAMNNCIK